MTKHLKFEGQFTHYVKLSWVNVVVIIIENYNEKKKQTALIQ